MDLRAAAIARTWATALALGSLIAADAGAQERAFRFALIGDMPYTKPQEIQFTRVVDVLNKADLAFVVHIGDIQADPRIYNRAPDTTSMPCVDENYKAMLDAFQRIRHPFILTPGDNEWTDCHHLQARKIDPLEALAKVRATYFPDGKSLGQRTIAVKSGNEPPQQSSATAESVVSP